MQFLCLCHREATMDQLTELRERHGWNQAKTAAFLGCTQPQIASWERGSVKPGSLFRITIRIGLGMPTPFADACAAAPAPDDPETTLKHALGVYTTFRLLSVTNKGRKPIHALGRLAVVVACCVVFAPEALGDLLD